MKRVFIFITIFVILLNTTGCRGRRQAQQAVQPAPVQQPAQPVQQPQAQQPVVAQGSDILFQDDFQDGNPDGWVISAGWTINQDGDVYTFGTEVAGAAYVKSGGATDYIYAARMKLDSGNASLIFHWSKSGRYLLQIQSDNIYLIKEAPAGTHSTLLQAPAPNLGQWHNFSIACEGGHIQVSIDQALALDYIDSSPLGRGTIGVGAADSTSVSVDDVVVSRLQQHLIQAQPPAQMQPAAQQPPPVIAAPPVDQSFEIENIEEEQEPEQQPEAPAVNQSILGQSDLTIRRLDIAKISLNTGEPVHVSVVVRNSGNTAAGAFTVAWLPDHRSNIIGCSWDVNRLEAGQEHDLSCDYPGYPQAGEFSSMAYADVEQEIRESDENNNSTRGDVTVQGSVNPPPQGDDLPDLEITTATHPDSVEFRDKVQFVIYIHNNGTAPAGAFTVIFIPDINTGLIACSNDFNGMDVGESTSVTCSYTYIDIGEFNFRNVVDSENEIIESNENNNVDTGSITVSLIVG